MKKSDMNLIIDDNRDAIMCYNVTGYEDFINKKWIIVRNFKEFKEFVEINGLPNTISFDHDLADFTNNGSEYTGLDCAKWLVNLCMDSGLELPKYYVHSSNTPGNENIKRYLDNFVKFNKNRN